MEISAVAVARISESARSIVGLVSLIATMFGCPATRATVSTRDRGRHARMMVQRHGDRAGIGTGQQILRNFSLADFQKERRHNHGHVRAILGRIPRVPDRLLEPQARNAGINRRGRWSRFARRDSQRPPFVFIEQDRFAGRGRHKQAVATVCDQHAAQARHRIGIDDTRRRAWGDHGRHHPGEPTCRHRRMRARVRLSLPQLGVTEVRPNGIHLYYVSMNSRHQNRGDRSPANRWNSISGRCN